MSRDTATEHLTSRRSDQATGHAHDLDVDADRPPKPANRTSLTGLRRVAEAPIEGASPAVERARRAQHAKVESASFDGVQAALVLGAHLIDDRAVAIAELMADPGEGGPIRSIDLMPKLFSGVDSDLRRLLVEVATQSSGSWAGQLKPEVRRLGGAVERFASAWGRAQSYAVQNGSPLHYKYNPRFLLSHVHDLYEEVGLDKAVPVDLTTDGRSTNAALKEAINANLVAAKACALSVTAAVTAGDTRSLQGDLQKLTGHLLEVEASLDHAPDRSVARSFAKPLREVLAAIHPLEKLGALHPSIHQAMHGQGNETLLKRLGEKVR